MNLVVSESDVILVDCVPLLDPDLVRARTGLCGDELLQIPDGVVLAEYTHT